MSFRHRLLLVAHHSSNVESANPIRGEAVTYAFLSQGVTRAGQCSRSRGGQCDSTGTPSKTRRSGRGKTREIASASAPATSCSRPPSANGSRYFEIGEDKNR